MKILIAGKFRLFLLLFEMALFQRTLFWGKIGKKGVCFLVVLEGGGIRKMMRLMLLHRLSK